MLNFETQTNGASYFCGKPFAADRYQIIILSDEKTGQKWFDLHIGQQWFASSTSLVEAIRVANNHAGN